MPTLARRLAMALLLAIPAGRLPAQDGFDYHPFTEALADRGAQALHTCNGLFVSKRTLEQISAGELGAAGVEPLPPAGVEVDHTSQTVAVGGGAGDGVPVRRAVLRPGLGCVVMAPNQTFDDLNQLPALHTPPLPGNPDAIAWPNGDLVPPKQLPAGVSGAALEAAGAWAFDRVAHGGHAGQVTLSLLVVYKGDIVLERYADGVDYRTPTRTAVPDPRRRAALRHVLNMSSGLYPVDNQYGGSIGSGLSYFAGWNSAYRAADRGLVREPGTMWDYENYDTLLGMLALKTVIGNDATYLEFPRRELFDKIGMRSTVPGVDRFGNFVLSSQVYTNARDLARLALLYLNRGMWDGQRILPESWVDFSRTAAPATAPFGNFYGAQWWLVQDARSDVPQDAYTMAGAQGQYAIVVPSHDLVIVRRG